MDILYKSEAKEEKKQPTTSFSRDFFSLVYEKSLCMCVCACWEGSGNGDSGL